MTCIEPTLLWSPAPNARYEDKRFFFTAGDEEQFQTTRSFTNGTAQPEADVSAAAADYAVYKINTFAVTDTFAYIFNRFKKGLFIRIIDNKVETFLPFSKRKFLNNWSEYIKIDPIDGSIDSFLKKITEKTNFYNDTQYRYDTNHVCKFIDRWVANNCLLRFEWPIAEKDTNILQIRHMFDALCRERKVKDIEFFVNRRDFPLLTKNLTEPYFHIFGYNIPLEPSIHFRGICPILSMSTSDKYADIAIPTHEDWTRVCSLEDILFPPDKKNYKYDFSTSWSRRKPTAVFRGASTGCGTSSELGATYNQRLRLAKISKEMPNDKFGVPLLDAGITKWNLRPRKIVSVTYLKTIDPSIEACTKKKLTPEEQTKYKYLINVDGHVSAFRLSLEMSMGCCMLIVTSMHGWKMWFQDKLIPYIHYVPIKSDLSDLIEKITWCRENDTKCETIAKNCLVFYKKHLAKKGILDFLEHTLNSLHDTLGVAHYRPSPMLKQLSLQKQWLNLKQPSHTKPPPCQSQEILGVRYPIDTLKELKVMLDSDDDFTSILEGASELVLQETKRTKVTKVILEGGLHYLSKVSSNVEEVVNEAFIGLRCINRLVNLTPNFVYTYKFIEPSTLLTEYINGVDLQNFMATEEATLPVVLEIIIQIMLTLEIAQFKYGFIHNDLKPWNIIIQLLKAPVIFKYNIKGQMFALKTMVAVCIIDYGKSHVIVEPTEDNFPMHFGLINPFKCIRGQDAFTLIHFIAKELNRRRDPNNSDTVFRMISYFIPKAANYREGIILLNKFNTYQDLVAAYKSPLLKLDKSPLDFIGWCLPLFAHYKLTFGKIPLEETVAGGFHLFKVTLPQPSDKLSLYFAAQRLLSNVTVEGKSHLFIKNLYKSLLNNYNHNDQYTIEQQDLNLGLELDVDMFRSLEECNRKRMVPVENYSLYTIIIKSILENEGFFKVTPNDRVAFNAILKKLPRGDVAYTIKVADINTYLTYCST